MIATDWFKYYREKVLKYASGGTRLPVSTARMTGSW